MNYRRLHRLPLVLVFMLIMSMVGAAASGSQATGFSERDVLIAAGDHRIPGTLTMPDTRPGAQVPAVLLLHGFASSRDEVGDFYGRLAEDLAMRGYASLRIDFAGSGDSRQPFVDNTFEGMVADARVSLDWLIARRSTDDARTGLVGFSLGSRIAAEVAGTDERVAALASWSGAVANGETNFEDIFDTYYPVAVSQGFAEVDLGFTVVQLSLAWFETMAASSSLDTVGAYGGPLLAIAGTDDTAVDPQWSRELVRWSGSLDATLRVLVGADHIYHVLTDDQTLAEEVLGITTDWFADKL